MSPPGYKRKFGLPMTERIRRSIVIAESGCWIWQHATDRFGYGLISITEARKLRRSVAHRASYEAFVGEIPAGLTLDHLCRTPACVNPDHLEPVTQAENNRRRGPRRAPPSRLPPPKTQCLRGHPFDESNTRVRPNGKRTCRRCERVNNDRSRAKQRELKETGQ